jgi:hypothetical protein
MVGVTEAEEFGKHQFYFCPRPCWDGESKTNGESDKNWYCKPPHAFECTREKIGALMGVSRVQG